MKIGQSGAVLASLVTSPPTEPSNGPGTESASSSGILVISPISVTPTPGGQLNGDVTISDGNSGNAGTTNLGAAL